MGIFNWLFGKTKVEKESKEQRFNKAISEGVSNVKDSEELRNILYGNRNSKGQFVKGVSNPYVSRNNTTGRFQKRTDILTTENITL